MTAAENKVPGPRISRTVWLAGVTARTVFLAILVVITARVASPQLEHFSSIWETPSDVIRLALGIAVCAWLIVHMFILPKDARGYRTWVYLGIALVPFAILVCIAVIR